MENKLKVVLTYDEPMELSIPISALEEYDEGDFGLVCLRKMYFTKNGSQSATPDSACILGTFLEAAGKLLLRNAITQILHDGEHELEIDPSSLINAFALQNFGLNAESP